MSTPKLHLYLLTGACSMAPHILLREAGLNYDKTMFTRDEVIKNGGYSAEYLKINPKAKVPTLKVNDEIITESLAIFMIISQLVPEKNYLGKTPMQTVRAYEWLGYLGSQVHGQGFGMFFRPSRFLDVKDGSLDNHVLAAGKQVIQDAFKYIDTQLEGKKWAVGDDFTAVDAYLFVFYRWGIRPTGLSMEQDYPNYARVMAALSERESVQEVLKIEGLI